MLEKTYEPSAVEGRIYQAWQDAGAFKAGAGARPGVESFTIVIPPPNVTGSLHIGHALNNTLQDILIRFERMRGKDVLWQPGTDHAGIATQMIVERQLAERQENRRAIRERGAFAQFEAGAPAGRHRLRCVAHLERRSPPPGRGGRASPSRRWCLRPPAAVRGRRRHRPGAAKELPVDDDSLRRADYREEGVVADLVASR